MKLVIQRVRNSRCLVDGVVMGETGRGLVVLVGVTRGDTEEEARRLARRTVALRIFEDAQGKMNLALPEIDGEVLAISQFTLYADTRKGNRPSFVDAAPPLEAAPIYEAYVAALRRELGERRVATGRFGAHMLIEMTNDGPVTLELACP